MRAFVNELALAEACAKARPSHLPILSLLEFRQRHRSLRSVLYCTRTLVNTVVDEKQSIADICRTLPREKIGLLFQWLVNQGPFVESVRVPVDDDLFQFEGIDVTDLGLGEAARRAVLQEHAAAFSAVQDFPSRFRVNPLIIVQGLVEDPIQKIRVWNLIDLSELADAIAAAVPEPSSWVELLASCRDAFDRLHIGNHCDDVLARHPFHPAAGRRIRNLLEVLQRLMLQMDCSGGLSASGVDLRERFFVGDRAWFTSESETRKGDKQRFTFPDPDGASTLVCYWHGKVSTPAFRVHFEWPVSRPSERLRVAYIGPHL